MTSLNQLKHKVSSLKIRRDTLRERSEALDIRLADINTRLDRLSVAIDITGLVIQGRYSKTIKFLEQVMTSGLQVTFDESFSVKMENKRKANKNNCTFLLACSKYPEYLPFKGCQGTGARQVTELIFLLVLISVVGGRKILFVDEPLTGIHKGARQEAIGEFLNKICKELDVQLIMVTHEENIAIKADNIIRLKG